MKWVSLFTTVALLSLGSNAQVFLGSHTIKSGAVSNDDSSNPWVQAVGAGTQVKLAFPFQVTPDPKTITWTISDVGNGQYTIFNDPAGYVTFVPGRLNSEVILLTDPTLPTAWTITAQNVTVFGNMLYTISTPRSSAPDSDVVWWTKHDSTFTLFADPTVDIADSPINRWWQLV